jgi:ribosomal protein L32
MLNGVLGYSTYYNNNESYLRGVATATEAEAVARAAIPVKSATEAANTSASNYGGFSKSSHFEGSVNGLANQTKMKHLNEEELQLLKKPDAAKTPQEVMEDSECKTCAERKYQDGSDDPGVSFKTAAHIAPEQAAAKVRSHEYEHVSREQAKARREDRKVVSQSVTIHTSICPECGKAYVSGGVTNTVTKGANKAVEESKTADNEKAQD